MNRTGIAVSLFYLAKRVSRLGAWTIGRWIGIVSFWFLPEDLRYIPNLEAELYVDRTTVVPPEYQSGVEGRAFRNIQWAIDAVPVFPGGVKEFTTITISTGEYDEDI